MLRNSILVADCSNLNLNQVPPSLPQNIEYLDISRNELSQISVENLQFPELRVLSLAENKLVSLPSDLFRNITELEHLDLQGNRILDIPGELFISTPSIRKVVGLHTVTTPVTLFHPARKMKSLSFIAEDDSISAKLFEVNGDIKFFLGLLYIKLLNRTCHSTRFYLIRSTLTIFQILCRTLRMAAIFLRNGSSGHAVTVEINVLQS